MSEPKLDALTGLPISPAPWRIADYNGAKWQQVTATWILPSCSGGTVKKEVAVATRIKGYADSRLIAAAPELYAMLKILRDYFIDTVQADSGYGPIPLDGRDAAIVERVNAALAKARGEKS